MKLSDYFIEKLGAVDFSTVLICFIILFFIIGWILDKNQVLKKIWDDFYNRKKKKEELYQLILQTKQITDEYCQNRINDRNQSLKIQEQLTKSIQEINDKLDKMKYDTDMRFLENQKQLQETREKTDKRTRAEMKDKISRAYRYYHAKKSWNYMEKEALLDLIEEYEAAGGKNSFVHSVVVPEMCLWEEITEFEGDVHEK
jgi:hypothetical protein